MFKCNPILMYTVLQRTPDKDCRQAEEPKQLVDEAIACSSWGASANTLRSSEQARCYTQQQSTAPQSGHALLTQVRSMCSLTPPCASFLALSVLQLSHGFQCCPTSNRQPYEGRVPLTSRWRKLSNTTVGQSILISLTHHC